MNEVTQIINQNHMGQLTSNNMASKPIVDRDKAAILILVYLAIRFFLLIFYSILPFLFTYGNTGHTVSWAIASVTGTLAYLLLPFAVRHKGWRITAFVICFILIIACLVSDGIAIHNMISFQSY